MDDEDVTAEVFDTIGSLAAYVAAKITLTGTGVGPCAGVAALLPDDARDLGNVASTRTIFASHGEMSGARDCRWP